MVRRYDPDRPVARATLDRILTLALRAPSAGFSQGWDFVVLDDPGAREAFWRATTDTAQPPDAWLQGMRTAPVLVVCLARPQAYLDRYAEPDKGRTDRDPDRWAVPFWDVDVGMAALLVHLAAGDAGLASCLFGVPGNRWEDLRAALDIPADRRPVAVVSLGHPRPSPRSPSLRRGRRPTAEVVHEGRFGRPWPPGGG